MIPDGWHQLKRTDGRVPRVAHMVIRGRKQCNKWVPITPQEAPDLDRQTRCIQCVKIVEGLPIMPRRKA